MGCFGSKLQEEKSKHTKQKKPQQLDKLKAKLKITRDKIQNLQSQYKLQITSLQKQIQKQKADGLKNKKKVIFLLKQKKQTQLQIENMQTRKKTVLNTLNSLNQQNLDKQMIEILEQSNKYMQEVQNQLQAKNWRQIIEQAKNKPQDVFGVEQEDPDVAKLFSELQNQVKVDKINKMQHGNGTKVQVVQSKQYQIEDNRNKKNLITN